MALFLCYNLPMKIGFFDSGVGGLTVLREFLNILEKEKTLKAESKKEESIEYLEIYYLADLINAPYGTRNADDLLNIIHKNINTLEKDYLCEYIVSACNSASAIYSKNIDYTEMIKPTANFCKIQNYKNSLLIATTATINSEIYQKEFEKIDINIDALAMPNLASLIEDGADEKIIEKYIILELEKNKIERQKEKQELDKIFDYHIYDNIILGCTHYPLVKNIFEKLFNQNILDPSIPVTKEIFDNLKSLNLAKVNIQEELEIKKEVKQIKVKLFFIQTKESKIFKNKAENMFSKYEYSFLS